jgi:hypothetical protein
VSESEPAVVGVTVTAEAVEVLKILPDKPVGPCEPVGPCVPVGPSIPSKFILYTFDVPYVPLIFVIPVMVIRPVLLSYERTVPSKRLFTVVESTTMTLFPGMYA